jgi:ParB family chromosome partitioning protein
MMHISRKPPVRKITDINIGSRHRHDFGDVAALVSSIADVGLLQPPAITPNGSLIAGMCRLEVVK